MNFLTFIITYSFFFFKYILIQYEILKNTFKGTERFKRKFCGKRQSAFVSQLLYQRVLIRIDVNSNDFREYSRTGKRNQ